MVRIWGSRPSDVAPQHLVPRAPRVGLSEPPIVDLRQWCTYVDDQVGQRCVGDSLVGANWVRVKAKGRRASARGVYILARDRERKRRGDAIGDVGCMPADGYDAAVSIGIFPRDDREDDPAQVNGPITWDEEVAAHALAPEDLEPIVDGDISSIDVGLAEDSPATYTQYVYQNYRDLRSGNPVWQGPSGTPQGLHRQVVVGRVIRDGSPCYVIWGSWGVGFADSGFAYVPCDLFAQEAHEIVIHHGGVIL